MRCRRTWGLRATLRQSYSVIPGRKVQCMTVCCLLLPFLTPLSNLPSEDQILHGSGMLPITPHLRFLSVIFAVRSASPLVKPSNTKRVLLYRLTARHSSPNTPCAHKHLLCRQQQRYLERRRDPVLHADSCAAL